MDAATEASPSHTCAACGSIRLTWRVKRLRAPGGYASVRTLAWHCQDCGGEWEEPLSGAAEAFPPAENGACAA